MDTDITPEAGKEVVTDEKGHQEDVIVMSSLSEEEATEQEPSGEESNMDQAGAAQEGKLVKVRRRPPIYITSQGYHLADIHASPCLTLVIPPRPPCLAPIHHATTISPLVPDPRVSLFLSPRHLVLIGLRAS